jgi:hypothetical protein
VVGADAAAAHPAADDTDGRGDGTDQLPAVLREAFESIRQEHAKRLMAQTYGEQRFKQVALHHAPSSDRSKVVSFVETISNDGSLAPLGLCALLHSVHATSSLRGRDAPKVPGLVAAQAMDECVLWGRSLHWLARALSIPDAIATRFRLVRRVLVIDRKTPPSDEPAHLRPRNLPVAQKCGLFFEAPGGELHLYVIGTLNFVVSSCQASWDGDAVGSLASDDKDAIMAIAQRWPSRAARVGCAFRVLPARYREFIVPRDTAPAATTAKRTAQQRERFGAVAEDYYVDGQLVFTTHQPPQPKRHHHHHRHHHHKHRYHGGTLKHRRTLSDGDRNPASCGSTFPLTPESRAAQPFGGVPPLAGTMAETDASSTVSGPQPLEVDSLLDHHNAPWLALNGQLTFVGVAGLVDFVRPKVESSIATLDNAGIRFVQFGAGTLQETRSFGARLGLKDEHNNCISLREQDLTIDDAYVRARLPRGVDDIRRHLVTTDAIPLKVPMFCGARSVRTRSMLSVMQDNHEVVVALGSPLNHLNVRAMIQADIAIAAEPCLRRGAAVDGEDVINRAADELYFRPDPDTADQLAALTTLLSTACTLSLTPTTQTLPMTVSLIRQARLLLKQLAQCTDFIVQCGCGVALLHVLTLLLTGGPLLMSSAQTLLIINVMAPVVGFGVAYTPMDVDVMTLMPTKHDAFLRVEMMLQWALWFAVRFVPTAVMIVAVGIGAHNAHAGGGKSLLFHRNPEFDSSAVEATQALCTLSTAYVLCWLSRTYLSRHTRVPLYRFDPAVRERERCALSCRRWLGCCGAAAVTVLAGVAATTRPKAWEIMVADTPVWCGAVVLLWPVVQELIDAPMKRVRMARYSFQQSLLRARFKTRLGMYSPIGSEDAFESRDPDVDAAPQPPGRTSCIKSFLVRWTSVDEGKAERQCVCEARGL